MKSVVWIPKKGNWRY